MDSSTKKPSQWAQQIAKQHRKAAKDRWGSGWTLLSEDQRTAFLAREAVSVLLAQGDEHASEQVKRLHRRDATG